MPVNGALVQHLDATVANSVTGSPVSAWADLSGNGNVAVANLGSVTYPRTSLAESGLAGLDFGSGRNDLESMDSSKASALLDFTGASSGNDGFSVLVAFKVDAMPGEEQHVIGTRHTLGYFAIKVIADGTVRLTLNGNKNASGSSKVAAGDTVVVGGGYKAATGAYQLWESKNGALATGTETANSDNLID